MLALMSAAPRLPHQPPRWLTPERIAMAAAVIGTEQVAWMVLEQVSDVPVVPLAIVPALTVMAIVWLASRRARSGGDAIVGTLIWAPLSTAVAVMAVLLWGRVGLHDLFLFGLGGLFIGLFVAQPLAPLAAVAAAGRARPSHEAPVRALLGGGAWLLAAEILLCVFTGASLITLVPGAAAVVGASVWIALRRRFLGRALAGLEPGYIVIASEGGVIESGLIPYRPLRRPCLVETLAAVAVGTDAGAGIYRDSERPIPLCIVGGARITTFPGTRPGRPFPLQ
jgi:hypothetical protein